MSRSMNIIFLGLCFSEDERLIQYNRSKCGLQSAPNNFQWALFNSVNEILDKEDSFHLLYAQPLGTYPKNHKDLLIPSTKWEKGIIKAQSVGYVNLPILKSICIQTAIKRELKKILTTCKGQKNIVITYNIYRPFLQSVYELKEKDLNFKIVNIVLDMTLNLGKVSNNIIRRIYDRFEERGTQNLKRSDAFVLLTEEMRYPLEVGERPFLVMEGLVDCTLINKYSKSLDTPKYVLYSGSLDFPYGIIDLIEAFIKYKDDSTNNLELWICGSGNMVNKIKEYSDRYDFIVFKGFVTREEALSLQANSYFLINPRPNKGEYVKYSFPSKTLEYMALGKVVLMHKLPGVPSEYDKYLTYFKSSNRDDMVDAIKMLVEKGENEINRLGGLCKEFAIEQKNALTQTKKVLNFLREII